MISRKDARREIIFPLAIVFLRIQDEGIYCSHQDRKWAIASSLCLASTSIQGASR